MKNFRTVGKKFFTGLLKQHWTALYESMVAFWGFKKSEHVHSE